mmetsp:Transcript_3905/g.6170  ORF Transcript_3905/g.6170 Transcript_3905/m.6170 type:complete len:111 (-) Transcript_3905:1182-1514(-)
MSGASDDWHTVSLRRTEEELRPKLNTKKELFNTPSRKDGIDEKTENKIRRKSVALIQEAGIRLELYDDTKNLNNTLTTTTTPTTLLSYQCNQQLYMIRVLLCRKDDDTYF